MVVALDDATDSWLAERSVPRYLKKLVSRTGSTDNHATSGLKFKILVDFLSIGCSVRLLRQRGHNPRQPRLHGRVVIRCVLPAEARRGCRASVRPLSGVALVVGVPRTCCSRTWT